MKITCFQITPNARLKETSSAIFNAEWTQGKGFYWVDIQKPKPSELKEWLEQLNISELAIELCLNQNKVSAVIPFDDEVYFEFPVCSSQSTVGLNDYYTSFLCLDKLIIAIYIDSIPDYDLFIQTLQSQLTLAKKSAPALLSAFLARESFRSSQAVDTLRATVLQLDERMDQNPDSVEAEEIFDQKRNLRSYDTLVNGQVACLKQLKVLDVPFLKFTHHSTYFHLATANTAASAQWLTRLEKTVSDLSQRFGSNQQEKTNRRLAVLTILSAIFMPLTLISGIYGMNFEHMSEFHLLKFHFSWGYPTIIITMLLIAACMYVFFKKKGWLD